MAERIEIAGGEYETEDGEEKNRFWIEVSSSLMNRVAGVATQEGQYPNEVLGEVVAGERSLADAEAGSEAAEADD